MAAFFPVALLCLFVLPSIAIKHISRICKYRHSERVNIEEETEILIQFRWDPYNSIEGSCSYTFQSHMKPLRLEILSFDRESWERHGSIDIITGGERKSIIEGENWELKEDFELFFNFHNIDQTPILRILLLIPYSLDPAISFPGQSVFDKGNETLGNALRIYSVTLKQPTSEPEEYSDPFQRALDVMNYDKNEAFSRGINFEGKTIVGPPATLEIAGFNDTYGMTVIDSQRVVAPRSVIPSCHADFIADCGWIIGTGIAVRIMDSINGNIFDVANGYGELITKDYVNTKKICLHIEYWVDEFVEAAFNIYAVPFLGIQERNKLGQLSGKNKNEEGWYVGTKTLTVPESLRSYPFKLMITVQENVGIRKIFGCNPDRKEDRFLVNSISHNITVFNFPKTKVLEKKDCLHGGKSDEYKCVCPAGFIGKTCEKGCGPNKFGPFCEGRCSSQKYNCRGMIFCRQNLGCYCAPGFKGLFCEENCLPGEYGIGCRENCGNCTDFTSCNIYTGKCHDGCQSGFIPPLCKKKYQYLFKQPNIQNVTFTSAVISSDFSESNLHGIGLPVFYQIQIKIIKPTNFKNEYQSYGMVQRISKENSMEETINDLLSGVTYVARVILFNKNFLSYDNEDVADTTFTTICLDGMLNISFENVSEGGFTMLWEDVSKDEFKCPSDEFEVGIFSGTKWMNYNTTLMGFQFSSLASEIEYTVRVRMLFELAKYHYNSIKTLPSGSEMVQDLNVKKITHNSVELLWSSPLLDYNKNLLFSVSYKCTEIIGNSKSCAEEDEKNLLVNGTRIIISGLEPIGKYSIRVNEIAEENYKQIQIITLSGVPSLAPSLKNIDITNSTALISWDFPDDCRLCNGFIQGFHYELMTSKEIISTNETSGTSVFFQDLVPSEEYSLKVYIVNDAGWNKLLPLTVDFITKSSVPSSVLGLTVYKTGRQIIGLRWDMPKQISGELDSFTVSTGSSTYNHKPQHCSAWPLMFCYTLTQLIPETSYNISVSARNNKIEEDGIRSYITGKTVENAPGMVHNLRADNVTHTTIEVNWEPPLYFNGVLRSFLIKIEQTDSYEAAECCQYYPKTEVIVKQELPEYHTQISGLSGGSSYALSVMAETVWLGPPSRISVATRPPPPATPPPLQISFRSSHLAIDWPQQDKSTEMNSTASVVGRLVLVLPPEGGPVASLKDHQLQNLVQQALNTSVFYLAAEYDEDTLDLNLGSMEEVVENEGKWGKILDPTLDLQLKYKVALVHISEYCKLYSISTRTSESFTL